MNEEKEFLEEHPSLKGKGWYFQSFEPKSEEGDFMVAELTAIKRLGMQSLTFKELSRFEEPPKLFLTNDIHETQIDKQNVLSTLTHWLQTEKGLLMKIKQELGLE